LPSFFRSIPCSVPRRRRKRSFLVPINSRTARKRGSVTEGRSEAKEGEALDGFLRRALLVDRVKEKAVRPHCERPHSAKVIRRQADSAKARSAASNLRFSYCVRETTNVFHSRRLFSNF